MRSAETRVAALAMLALLGGCASTPPVAVVKPAEAVQQAVTNATQAVTAAVAPPAPVDAQAQRDFEAAKAALRAGRTADAERGFKDVAAKHPQLGGAHANLGVMLRNAGKHDESVAALERAVKASPKQPAFWNQLGVSYRHQGQFTKAREAYEQALALDANHADTHLNLGVLLDLYLGDNALALVHYERYLALAPGGDAAVGKWVADLKTRKPNASVAQADVKTVKKDP
jgi:tetratricopeptide (TPR) repeat protein